MTLAMSESMEVLLILGLIVFPTVCLLVLLGCLAPDVWRSILCSPRPSMTKKAWTKVYGHDAIRILRKIVGMDEDSRQALKDMLDTFNPPLDMMFENMKRELTRREADAAIDSGSLPEKHQLIWLTAQTGYLYIHSEDENKEDDAKRFRKLSLMYDELMKHKTKLKVTCPFCKHSLKGVTEAMIGDTAVCLKCKSEFTIEKKGNQTKDKHKNRQPM